MDLPVKAQVYGRDGHIGRATQLILEPLSMSVTHLVVKAEGLDGRERLVPLQTVTTTHQNRIDVSCTKADFESFAPFTETHFVDPGLSGYDDWDVLGWPYVSSIESSYAYQTELVPKGELAVRRGMRVEARDGAVGRVDEFVLEPKGGHIGHLVMRQGHIFGEKDVFVPVSDIAKVEPGCVHLKLNKHEVEELVTVPVRQLWEGER